MRLPNFLKRPSVARSGPSTDPAGPTAKDPIDEWIGSVVDGRTFADIGGVGLNAVNERVTFALEGGASSATMIDIMPADFEGWHAFRAICKEKGISGYRELPSIDVNDPQLARKIGTYDVVHCTGIMYHLASPLAAFENLRSVVGEYLIINTVIVPDVIENRCGRLEFSGSVALFLPGISDHERDVLSEHYRSKFGYSIDDIAPRLSQEGHAHMPWRERGGFSCWPYWWLLSEAAFRALIKLMGFQILEEWVWQDHALAALARKVEEAAAD